MTNRTRIVTLLLGLLALSTAAVSQTPTAKPTPQKAAKAEKGARPVRERPDPLANERQATAITLVTSLADEARSFRDEQLRARVLVQAADALWETDVEQARSLFHRAWDAADSADREGARRFEEKSRARVESGGWSDENVPELRSEVLRVASRRDRALGEEFLVRLSEATARENQSLTINADNSAAPPPTPDPQNPPIDIGHRLALARQFLEEGDTARALQFADKALDRVSIHGINFLSLLREKDPAAADKRFNVMFERAAADSSSDATTVSVLSSYAFTPFYNIVVQGNGSNHSMQEREHIVAPNISPALRASFLRAAARILLRPVPPPDQDRTLAGRGGLYFTIARMLPLYEQYAPDFSPELRAQASALAPDAPESFRDGTDSLLTRGLVPQEQMRDEGREALESADRAANPEERDSSYARAALEAAHKGDTGARDQLDKIQNSEMRKSARAYIDFVLVSKMIEKKDAQEALRLARSGEFSSIHRVWALTEVASLLKKTDAKSAAEVLDEAANEARRIGGSEPDRARALFGVATRMYEVDRNRAWELVAEAARAANSATGFTGADAQIVSRFATQHGATTMNFTADSFDVNGIFGLLARDDLFRSIELAKSFTGEAPRAAATLAIVHAVLDKKRRDLRNERQSATKQ